MRFWFLMLLRESICPASCCGIRFLCDDRYFVFWSENFFYSNFPKKLHLDIQWLLSAGVTY